MAGTKKRVGKIISKISDVQIPGTGRKYKKELQRAEEQFRSIFEYSGTGMLVIAPDLTILQANHKASELSGYPLSMLEQGHKWSDFIKDRKQLAQIMEYRENRIASGSDKPIQYETNFRHANGSERRLLFNVSQIPGSENILSSFIDITDLYDIHSQLEESELRFKETAELLPVVICEFDRQMNFTYVNKKGYELFEYPDDVVDQNKVQLTDFFIPEELPHVKKSIERRWKDHTRGPEEYRMITRNGQIRNFLIISSVIMKDDEPVGLRSCLVDITDLRQVKKELDVNERRLQTMFDSSPIGITVLNAEGIPQEMNRSFRALFQIRDDETAAMPSLFPALDMTPEMISTTAETIRGFRLIKGKEASAYETILSDQVFYSWHITPLQEDGATHYLCQVIDITEQYMSARDRIMEAEQMVEGLKKELTRKSTFDSIVSRSPALQAQFEMLPTIASTTTTLLITGDSGTGKELMAQTVHNISDRKKKPFVAINCGALPDTLLESELFGHKKGAFTDAKSDRKGKFQSAHGGTIFLDEIGEISPTMQVKLLRVLQERQVEPLGADETVSVDVRVIAATNRDLAQMVKEGTFREDLYYRIKVLHIQLPPLRKRREDIPLLCDHFVSLFNNRFQRNVSGLTTEALDLLLSYSFPGNIRELQNILEHAFIFCSGDKITADHLPEELKQKVKKGHSGDIVHLDTIHSLDELETVFLEHMIGRNGGNKTETAKALGVHKATLFRKLKKLGMSDKE